NPRNRFTNRDVGVVQLVNNLLLRGNQINTAGYFCPLFINSLQSIIVRVNTFNCLKVFSKSFLRISQILHGLRRTRSCRFSRLARNSLLEETQITQTLSEFIGTWNTIKKIQ